MAATPRRKETSIDSSDQPRSETGPAKGAFIFLVISAFISSMGFGLATPVLPKLVMELAGTELAEAARWGGFAVFLYAVMQFVFSPILGALSDRYGRRPVLLLSLAAFAIDMLVLGLVDSLWAFLVVRAFAGVFAATFSTTNAYVADVTPKAQRGIRFAWIGAAFGAGFIFGPALGGMLGEIDLRLPFLFGAGLATINTLFGYFVVTESLSEDKRRPFSWERANTFGTLTRLFRTPGVTLLLPVYFFATLSSWVYPTVWSYVAIERFAWSDQAVGFSIAYYGVIAFISSAVVIQVLLPKIGVVRAIWIALIVEAVALTGIGLATDGWMVYAMITLALISSMQDPAIRQELSNRVDEDAQGELQGGLSALTSVAMILAPVVYMGLFTISAGDKALIYLPGSPFIAAAAMSLLTLALYLIAMKSRPPDEDIPD
ncbi:MAG: TCR/Tet family MFS transporter [Pseudomonadota bacterium]